MFYVQRLKNRYSILVAGYRQGLRKEKTERPLPPRISTLVSWIATDQYPASSIQHPEGIAASLTLPAGWYHCPLSPRGTQHYPLSPRGRGSGRGGGM